MEIRFLFIYKMGHRLFYFIILSLMIHIFIIMTVKSGFDVIKVKLYDTSLIVVNDVSLSKENKLVAGSNNGAAVHSTLPIMKKQTNVYSNKNTKSLSAIEDKSKSHDTLSSAEEADKPESATFQNSVDLKDVNTTTRDGNSGSTVAKDVSSEINEKKVGLFEGNTSGLTSLSTHSLTQQHFDKKRYLSFIVDYVKEHIPYPYLARKRGIEGDLKVGIVVDQNGKISSVKVIKSSGYQILDDNTIKYFTELILPKKPEDTASFEIEVSYRLRG